jgi:hypothetical protein
VTVTLLHTCSTHTTSHGEALGRLRRLLPVKPLSVFSQQHADVESQITRVSVGVRPWSTGVRRALSQTSTRASSTAVQKCCAPARSVARQTELACLPFTIRHAFEIQWTGKGRHCSRRAVDSETSSNSRRQISAWANELEHVTNKHDEHDPCIKYSGAAKRAVQQQPDSPPMGPGRISRAQCGRCRGATTRSLCSTCAGGMRGCVRLYNKRRKRVWSLSAERRSMPKNA